MIVKNVIQKRRNNNLIGIYDIAKDLMIFLKVNNIEYIKNYYGGNIVINKTDANDREFKETKQAKIEQVENYHKMKLESKSFDCILNGTKRIELRLNDIKRQKVKVGDTIKFYELPDLTKTIEVEVIGLLKYNNFTNLLNDFDPLLLFDKSINKEELNNLLNKFYSKVEQAKYEALGIRIKLK